MNDLFLIGVKRCGHTAPNFRGKQQARGPNAIELTGTRKAPGSDWRAPEGHGTEPVKAVTAPMTQRMCSHVETTDGGDSTACPNKHLAKGYCRKHYLRWYKYGDPSVKNNRWGQERDAKTKFCGKCERELPIDCFYRRGSKSPGRVSKCKDCWRPPLDRERARNLRPYGVTLDLYGKLLERQGGGCAICGATESAKGRPHLSVDHHHVTGAVRGLLCGRCNTGIGMLGDDPDRLRAAIRYLEAAGLFAA